MKFHSFDIFDTTIMRKVIRPSGVFLMMQYYLENGLTELEYPKSFKSNFCQIRMEAEEYARAYTQEDEIQLEDIYGVLSDMTEASEAHIAELSCLEQRIEIEISEPMKKTIYEIKQLRQSGEKVVFISNMYLSGIQLKKILQTAGIDANIPIYVSSEVKRQKNSGLLYKFVMEKENAEFSEWIHTGDDDIADITVPQLFGMKTHKVQTFHAMPWEEACIKRIDINRDVNNGLGLQLVLGLANCVIQNSEKPITDAFRIGMTSGAVVLMPYVEWIIDICQKRNITTLYFIARDGYILKKLADQYIDTFELEIRTDYIYGSREAWGCKDRETEKLAIDYLKQELAKAKGKYAFVDLHGSGTSISRMAQKLGVSFEVFYMGMDGDYRRKKCRFHIYTSFVEFNLFIELFARAPHGETLLYCRRDGRIEPVLRAINEDIWRRCGLYDYIDGAELLAGKYYSFCQRTNLNLDLRMAGRFMMRYAMKTPDAVLSNFFGDMPHNFDNERDCERYAPKLSEEKIRTIFYQREREPVRKYYKEGQSFEYSMLRMSSNDRKLMQECKKNYFMRQKREKLDDALKIIIYGAGNKGKEVYRRIFMLPDIELAGWVDLHYEKCRKEGYDVQPVCSIKSMRYDKILIAIENRKTQREVRNILSLMGIGREYIIGNGEFEEKYLGIEDSL